MPNDKDNPDYLVPSARDLLQKSIFFRDEEPDHSVASLEKARRKEYEQPIDPLYLEYAQEFPDSYEVVEYEYLPPKTICISNVLETYHRLDKRSVPYADIIYLVCRYSAYELWRFILELDEKWPTIKHWGKWLISCAHRKYGERDPSIFWEGPCPGELRKRRSNRI